MTNNQATLDKLDRMRLHGMARALRTSLETQSQCTDDELLAHLVDAEWDNRHERRLKRLLKAARFRYPAAIEEVDFALRALRALRGLLDGVPAKLVSSVRAGRIPSVGSVVD